MKNIIEEMLVEKHSKESIAEELNRLIKIEKEDKDNPITHIECVDARKPSIPSHLQDKEIIGITKTKYSSTSQSQHGYDQNGRTILAPQSFEEETVQVVYGIRRKSVINMVIDEQKKLNDEINKVLDEKKTSERSLKEHIVKLRDANASIDSLHKSLTDSQKTQREESERRMKLEADFAKIKQAIGELKYNEILGVK